MTHDELNPPEFELSPGEREHLTLLRQPNDHFLAQIGERESFDGDTLHPKAQWFPLSNTMSPNLWRLILQV